MLVDLQAQEAVDVIHHSCLQTRVTPKGADLSHSGAARGFVDEHSVLH